MDLKLNHYPIHCIIFLCYRLSYTEFQIGRWHSSSNRSFELMMPVQESLMMNVTGAPVA